MSLTRCGGVKQSRWDVGVDEGGEDEGRRHAFSSEAFPCNPPAEDCQEEELCVVRVHL